MTGPVAGLLLAAGAGRRMGGPKALVELDGEALVARGVRALGAAGLAPRIVVLGAGAPRAAAVVAAADPGARCVVAADWETGMGASLVTGLRALAEEEPAPAAAVVALVDTPGIGAAALARVAGAPGPARTADTAGPVDPTVLARGTYRGRPGHPVLLGAAHWPGIVASAGGDAGARTYLAGRTDVRPVEMSDVADPGDLDTPEDLHRARRDRAPSEEG